jgi:RNA ligase (TIGR02306 family)
MRKLASIQKIDRVSPIVDADAIELVHIKGWQCVSKKGEFQAGDFCIYFEIDAYLPIDERFEFLRKNSYRNNEYMNEGFRVKSMKMRGEISQGLAMPVSLFPELSEVTLVDEAEVTELLGVRKWEMPETVGSMGVMIGEKPFGIPTTDETRIQSLPTFIEALRGKPYYISTKLDGTSCTLYVMDGQVGICGRNYEYKEDVDSSEMWRWFYERGLKEKFLALGRNIVLQGEFCGPGIQKNPLKLMKPNFFTFDFLKLEQGIALKQDLKDMLAICNGLQIDVVPIEEKGNSFDYTMEDLLKRAEGKYDSGVVKEGIVIRTQTMESCEFYDTNQEGERVKRTHRLSFKVINNQFLLKEQG